MIDSLNNLIVLEGGLAKLIKSEMIADKKRELQSKVNM